MNAALAPDELDAPIGAWGRCTTHLERAFRVFKAMHPQPMTARGLAVRMNIEPSMAYKYVARLKRAKCIEVKGGSGKIPLYGLVEGATAPREMRGHSNGFECLIPIGAETVEGTAKIAPSAVHLLSPSIQSAAAVRHAVGLEDLAAAHPLHELFVLWFKQDPQAPFAVVLRLSKERIAKDGWPLIVDPETRVVAFEAAARG